METEVPSMKKSLLYFLYNVGRAIASLCGAPPQESISSEIGRHESNPVDEEAADILDDIQKNHESPSRGSNARTVRREWRGLW